MKRAMATGFLGWGTIAAVLTLGLSDVRCSAATIVVDPDHMAASDENAGTVTEPLKTVSKAVEKAVGGDLILLGNGSYPGIRVSATYETPLTIAAAEGATPRCQGTLDLSGARGVRIRGLLITWPQGNDVGKMTPFIDMAEGRDIEISDCNVFDNPEQSEWRGLAANISGAKHVTMRDCEIHYVYFGVAVTQSETIRLEGLDIGPWTHEDGIRVTECLGPVLVDGCHLTNAGIAGRKGGHVDAIQVVFWSDNLTIRNCEIHGVSQAIGAFHCVDPRASIPDRRRKNWRIEGNVIYDVHTPHYATVCETDGVVVINNTFPQGRVNIFECTGAVVKNNIFGSGGLKKDAVVEADYNIWINGGEKLGEHDLVGVDPQFVNGETAFLKIRHKHLKECTRTKLFPHDMKGRLAIGDKVEIVMSDGSARDGSLYGVTGLGDNWIEIDPPLPADPGFAGVLIYKWPEGQTNLCPDYRLLPGSPAIDSADSSIDRGRDRDGREPVDVPSIQNSGAGPVPYLDRGAFEWDDPLNKEE